jgi:hypothetical protein
MDGPSAMPDSRGPFSMSVPTKCLPLLEQILDTPRPPSRRRHGGLADSGGEIWPTIRVYAKASLHGGVNPPDVHSTEGMDGLLPLLLHRPLPYFVHIGQSRNRGRLCSCLPACRPFFSAVPLISGPRLNLGKSTFRAVVNGRWQPVKRTARGKRPISPLLGLLEYFSLAKGPRLPLMAGHSAEERRGIILFSAGLFHTDTRPAILAPPAVHRCEVSPIIVKSWGSAADPGTGFRG